jgi:hypothetical protein
VLMMCCLSCRSRSSSRSSSRSCSPENAGQVEFITEFGASNVKPSSKPDVHSGDSRTHSSSSRSVHYPCYVFTWRLSSHSVIPWGVKLTKSTGIFSFMYLFSYLLGWWLASLLALLSCSSLFLLVRYSTRFLACLLSCLLALSICLLVV